MVTTLVHPARPVRQAPLVPLVDPVDQADQVDPVVLAAQAIILVSLHYGFCVYKFDI